MEQFEEKLRNLPVREPSRSLDDRIRALGREKKKGFRILLYRKISLAWAATLSIITGLLGFALAMLWLTNVRPPITPGREVVNVQIVYQSAEEQPIFDFTNNTIEVLPDDATILVDTDGEVSL